MQQLMYKIVYFAIKYILFSELFLPSEIVVSIYIWAACDLHRYFIKN